MPREAPGVTFGVYLLTPVLSKKNKIRYAIKQVDTQPEKVGNAEQMWVV